jgi:hypothetical protein
MSFKNPGTVIIEISVKLDNSKSLSGHGFLLPLILISMLRDDVSQMVFCI